MQIRLGTRQSALATWQAEWVAGQLRALGCEVVMVPITTTGDVSTRPLGEVGGQGLFTKEIQRALLDGRCDLAVHSLKDLPTEPVEGLRLTAVPPREEVGDALISAKGVGFAALPQGAIVGTGSIRRAAQLRRWRSDIEIRDIRGNLDTRLRKLDEGQYDAILLAVAGMKRLGLDGRISEILSLDRILPAVGQAALGLETRNDDPRVIEFVSKLNDEPSYAAVVAERTMLRELRGGCLAPVAALATVDGERLRLRSSVFSLDGLTKLEADLEGPRTDPEELGKTAARLLQKQGASDLIASARG